MCLNHKWRNQDLTLRNSRVLPVAVMPKEQTSNFESHNSKMSSRIYLCLQEGCQMYPVHNLSYRRVVFVPLNATAISCYTFMSVEQ